MAKRRPIRRAILGAVAALFVSTAIAAPGCAPPFDPPSKVETLRILAVDADKPYANPGDDVTFTMTYDDGYPTADGGTGGRPIEILWLGGCFDPLGDEYFGCYPSLATSLKGLGPGSALPPGTIGLGDHFTIHLPSDIISRRPPPPTGTPFGLAYVFFAVCAGNIKPIPPDGTGKAGSFPLGCFDEDGNQLDMDSFVPGYTQVYAFADKRTNANPIATSLDIKPDGSNGNGVPTGSGGAGESDADGGPLGAGGTSEVEIAEPAPSEIAIAEPAPILIETTTSPHPDGGAITASVTPAPIATSASTPFPDAIVSACAVAEDDRATQEAQQSGGCGRAAVGLDSCTTYDLKVIVDSNIAELDPDATGADGTPLHEAVWVDYYADGGDFKDEIKLVSAADTGYNEDHGAQWIPPAKTGFVTIWAVLHDSRGGGSVIERKILVQ